MTCPCARARKIVRGPDSLREATSLLAALILLSGCSGPREQLKGGFVPAGAAAEQLAPACPQGACTARKLLLAVGIDRYRPGGGWHDLRYAAADARAVSELLQREGGFRTVGLLTGEVRQEELLAALDRLAAQIRDPGDVALVYVSGHGTLARGASGSLARYLVTSETEITRTEGTALPVSLLQERFDRLGSARKVMILATCHAGEGKSALPRELLAELSTYKSAFFPAPLEEVSRAAVVIGASAWGEPAREDPQLQHDVYTYYLLEAVRKRYDPDRDGAVTLGEAHDYARRLTYRHSGGRQRPTLRSDILGADPIVLAGQPRATPLPLLLSFSGELEGFSLQVDGQDKGVLPAGVALPPGRHELALLSPSGDVVLRRELELQPGQRVVLEEELAAGERPSESATAALLLGYQLFLDSRSRARMVEPLLLPRLHLSRKGWTGPLRLAVELALTPGPSRGTAELQMASGGSTPIDYRSWEGQAGVSASLPLARRGAVELSAGAVLALLWFQRTLELPGGEEEESYASFAPALELGARWQPGPHLAVLGGVRISYLAFRVDQAWRHLALGELSLGLGLPF